MGLSVILVLAFCAVVYGQRDPCLKPCLLIYKPVCGSDLKTYSSPCEQEVASCRAKAKGDAEITVAYFGPCCNTACTKIYRPVCGSDGETYPNSCLLNKESCILQRMGESVVSVAHSGECRDPCQVVCPLQYDPVCGSDGVTYENECELRIGACYAQDAADVNTTIITLVSRGPCKEPCQNACPQMYSPVCGSDGQTYSSDCDMKVAACNLKKLGAAPVTRMYMGECRRSCVKVCALNYSPVCGSDGTTYSNECQLKAAACVLTQKGGTPLALSTRGECGATCVDMCPMSFQPVCGSDGKDYNNECALKAAACKMRRQGSTVTLTVRKRGLCRAMCMLMCPMSFEPVCGTNGKTYPNLCSMTAASCMAVQRKPNATAVEVAYDGACETQPCRKNARAMACNRSYVPVCGTDAKTYPNLCLLKRANCMSRKRGARRIRMDYEGVCQV